MCANGLSWTTRSADGSVVYNPFYKNLQVRKKDYATFSAIRAHEGEQHEDAMFKKMVKFYAFAHNLDYLVEEDSNVQH